MKKIIIISLIASLSISLNVFAQKSGKKQDNEPAKPAFELKTKLDSISYIIGTDIAFTLKNNGMDLNAETFNKGFTDAWNGHDTIFTREQAEAIMMKYGSEMQAKREEENAARYSENMETGKKFLEENKSAEGVVTTESGLQYQILELGDGDKPLASNKVTVHYKGTLLNGTVFDSSYDRGKPATFELSRLIPGWTEGIQLMPMGSKFKFFIPSELGYGSREAGIIPPHSVLIFEVELLDIE